MLLRRENTNLLLHNWHTAKIPLGQPVLQLLVDFLRCGSVPDLFSTRKLVPLEDPILFRRAIGSRHSFLGEEPSVKIKD